MFRLLTGALLFVTIPACGGGDKPEGGVCTTERVPGISVTLIDAARSRAVNLD